MKRPTRASRSSGILRRRVPLASSASASGSRSPATSARSIATEETPIICEATEESLMPASWSTLSKRCDSRARSSIWALR